MRMASIFQLKNTWDTITEIQMQPLAQEALRGVRIALVGAPGSGRSILADLMRRDPVRPGIETDTPVLILDLENAAPASDCDLIILLMDGQAADYPREKELARAWINSGKQLLVFINLPTSPEGDAERAMQVSWKARNTLVGPVDDVRFLRDKFVPLVIQLLPGKLLGLGRGFPLFRVPIAHWLINDANISNASYAFATGLVEIVLVLNVPLTVTDMVVLTKNQAFLAYKLGLNFGFSTRWQDYLAEFSGVLGFGFAWRQIARSLVGLIPGFGIIPKVGIAYAGTAVVGNAILNWYLTGRHISKRQLNALYQQTYSSGKKLVHKLTPHLVNKSQVQPKMLPARRNKVECTQCGRRNAWDASFCQYCGQPFSHSTLTPHRE